MKDLFDHKIRNAVRNVVLNLVHNAIRSGLLEKTDLQPMKLNSTNTVKVFLTFRKVDYQFQTETLILVRQTDIEWKHRHVDPLGQCFRSSPRGIKRNKFEDLYFLKSSVPLKLLVRANLRHQELFWVQLKYWTSERRRELFEWANGDQKSLLNLLVFTSFNKQDVLFKKLVLKVVNRFSIKIYDHYIF